MSGQQTVQLGSAEIENAVTAMDSARGQFGQLEALFMAIQKECGEGSQGWRLSELGAYLAMDFANCVDAERETLSDTLAGGPRIRPVA